MDGSAILTKSLETVDKGKSALRRFWGSKGVAATRQISSEIAKGMHLKTGGFALKAGLMGAAGGGVGYAYGQGRGDGTRDAVIGAGMGVFGAFAHSGIRSAYRTGVSRVRQAETARYFGPGMPKVTSSASAPGIDFMDIASGAAADRLSVENSIAEFRRLDAKDAEWAANNAKYKAASDARVAAHAEAFPAFTSKSYFGPFERGTAGDPYSGAAVPYVLGSRPAPSAQMGSGRRANFRPQDWAKAPYRREPAW